MRAPLLQEIQKKLKESTGLTLDVNYAENNKIVIKRLLKIVASPRSMNEIDLEQAKKLNENASMLDTISLDYEPNGIELALIKSLEESYKTAEDMLREREILEDTIRSLGISEGALIFCTYLERSVTGNLVLDYKGKVVEVPPSKQVQTENFVEGEEVPVIVTNVIARRANIKITASRNSTELVAELIKLTLVDCNWDVKIKKILRVPGYRSKVMVWVENGDPVGLTVGSGGFRIKKVLQYLKGERIDISPYSDSTPLQIMNLINPNWVVDIFFHFQYPYIAELFDSLNPKKAFVVVPDDYIKAAVGMKGYNSTLASRGTGWIVKILGESEVYNLFTEHGKVEREFKFDWDGVELENEIVQKFYSGVLSMSGICNFSELYEFERMDFDSLEYLDSNDRDYLYNFIQSMCEEVFCCPECGSELISTAEVCPHCGVELSLE